MVEGRQHALAVHADAQRLPRRWSMADGPVHLVAAKHQLDRSADQPGRQNAEDLRPGDEALGAEPTAQKGAADVDVLRRDAEEPGDPCLRHGHALAGHIDGEPVAVPCGDDRVRLHRVVVLRRRLVGRLDAPRGCGEPRLDIADLRLGRVDDPDGGGDEALDGVEADAGKLPLIAGGEERGAFRRGFQGLGDDDRDRLVRVANLVILQEVEPEHERVQLRVRVLRQRRSVGGRHDFDDARIRLRGRHVEEADAAARDAAHCEIGVEHAGWVIVGRVAGSARDLQDAVPARERLPDTRAVPQASGSLGERDLRHRRELRD